MNKVGSHGRRRFLTVVNIHSVFYIHVYLFYFNIIYFLGRRRPGFWRRTCLSLEKGVPFHIPFHQGCFETFLRKIVQWFEILTSRQYIFIITGTWMKVWHAIWTNLNSLYLSILCQVWLKLAMWPCPSFGPL